MCISGYPEGVKGYKLWCTDLHLLKAIISRDVEFNELKIFQKQHALDNKTEKQQNKLKNLNLR